MAGSIDLVKTHVTKAMHEPTTMTTTTTDNTGAPIVPPTPGPSVPPAPPSRSRGHTGRLWIALAVTGGLLVTALVSGSLIEVPYYAFSPGSAVPTAPLVQVGGGPCGVHPSEGEILFLTVRIGPVTAVQAAAGWVDGNVDLYQERAVLGDRTEDENRAAQAAAMVGSKQVALVVALQRLGIELNPTGSGAVVTLVTPGSPAEDSVIVTDTIVAVDGVPIRTTEQLGEEIGRRAPGETVTLDIEALSGEVRQETVTLIAREDNPAAGFFGVATDTRAFDPGAPFSVDIEQGRVGGPSAGLAFTLAMIDVLTPGDLTGGRRVAVTGAIAADGTVLEVGGVAQKASVAAGAGATALLVPAGEEAQAQRNPHGVEVIGVANLEEALAALERLGGDPLPEGACQTP